jgi:uncharacterized repeat protein (TIGR01451 family)
MKALLPTFFLAAGLMLAQAGLAQAPAVTSKLVAQRVETVGGKVVLTPADAGKPGDLVQYTGTYHNAGAKGVDKLIATIPVPAGTTFVAGGALPARAQASTDGVRFSALPLTRSVRQPDGSTREQPVPLAEYRAVRWELGTLAAGADATVALRVRIDSAASAAAPGQ